MDHAAVEARREKILPGDLLQGILRLPITLIYLARSPDATCWTLSNYFQARNFARFYGASNTRPACYRSAPLSMLFVSKNPENLDPLVRDPFLETNSEFRQHPVDVSSKEKREKGKMLLYILFSNHRSSLSSFNCIRDYFASTSDTRISTTLPSSLAQPRLHSAPL